MNCITKLDHYPIPNDIVVTLTEIYRRIGGEVDRRIKGSDLNKTIDKTIAEDAYYLAGILKLEIGEERLRLITEKNSAPRTKEETTLANLKEVLKGIGVNEEPSLQSNDIYNTVNYVYSHYNVIQFDLTEGNRSVLRSQNKRSKRLILDEMNGLVKEYLRTRRFEKIVLFLNYFIDFYNVRPFIAKNETISLLILYQLVLAADIGAFRCVSFFEILYHDYDRFSDELRKASVNWQEGFAQTTSFVRYFLNLIQKGYAKADEAVAKYRFDCTDKKIENIESSILNQKAVFTKAEIRKANPYVSESTINRALIALRDEGRIEAVGKGRSARWIRKK